MSAHRFREHLRSVPQVSGSDVPLGGGFVPCPMFHAFSAAQQAQVVELYRVAAERTREQLRAKRNWLPQFSAN